MKGIRKDKGVAGLTVLLSVIVSLFIIGLLVMIFALMGGRLMENRILYTMESGRIINESLTTVSTGDAFSVSHLKNVNCNIEEVTNTTGQIVILAANYTQTGCLLTNATTRTQGYLWNVTYTYTFWNPTAAVGAINETSASNSSVTDWFPLFVVITAMVVLILLTVIIITAIRSSGLMGGGSSGKEIGKTGHA